MSIPFVDKVNKRLIAQAIVSESHVVGITGVAVVTPGLIRLVETPEAPSPLLPIVSIPGYNEITVGSPTGTQFLVNYLTGVITFNVSQDGNAILVSYNGLGSEFAAEDVNELQGPVGVALNYNGSLSNNIVKPASISNTGTDDFIFPRDVTAIRETKAADFITASASPASTGVLRLAHTDVIAWRNFAGSGDDVLDSDGSDDLRWKGNVIATGAGAVTSITGTTNQIIASSSVGAITLSTPQDINITSSPTFVSLILTGSLTQSETYSGSGSNQGIASDETLSAGAGSNTSTNPKYLASIMGNVHGSSLTRISNYIGGVIGADSVTGVKATTYPKGAVLAQITDGVTESDGAVVAYIDGDSSVTLANAAFKAMQNNSQSGSGFTYGLDLFGAAHNGYLELSIKNAAIRMDHEVCILNGSGIPTNAVTGATFAEIGSLYMNTTSGALYSNTGTKASPIWTEFDTGSIGANQALSNLSAVAINTSLLPGSDNSINLGSAPKRWKNLFLSGTSAIDGNETITNTTPSTDALVITNTTPSQGLLVNGKVQGFRDNGSSVVVKGHQDPSEGVAVVSSYSGIFFDSGYNVAGTLKTRFITGGNLEMDVELQSPHMLRLTAGDNTTTDASIRMSSNTNVMIQARAENEVVADHYLIVDRLDTTVHGFTNISEVNLTTNSGSLYLNYGITDGAIVLPSLDTTQQNALTPVAGMIIFNSNTSQFVGYDGTSWNILG
jgi:hypothetical protein